MTEFPSPFPAFAPLGVRRSLTDDDFGALASSAAADDDTATSTDDDTEPSTDDDAAPAPRREGLPPSFRMRHESHYVDAIFDQAPSSRPARSVAPVEALSGGGAAPAALGSAARVIGAALAGVTRVLETLPSRGRSLHDRVALDLLRAETVRARAVAEAMAVLHADLLPALDEVDLVATLSAVLDGFAFEDRLAGVAPAARPHGTCRVFGDPELLHTAITALVTATRTLAAGRGDLQRIGVSVGPLSADGLRTLRIDQWAVRVPAASLARVFDTGWDAHPAGPTGAVLLAAARRIAAAQGGDVVAEALEGGGCAFVLRLPPAG